MKRIVIFICLSMNIAITGIAQDIHFSQFNFNPLTINPGLTGVFYGDQRASINYKDQWQTFGAGFRTTAFSFDSGIMKKKWSKAYIGAGINVFKDVAGDAQLGSTKVLVSFSSIIKITKDQKVSAGIQLGKTQNSINPDNLMWDDQYVGGAYSSSNLTMDGLNMEPFNYNEVSAGVSWDYRASAATMTSYDATQIQVGVALHHINKPELGFVSANERLYRKVVIHGNSHFGITNTHIAIKPSFMIALQGPSKEIVIGTLFRLRTKEASHFTGYFSESGVAVGAHYRVGDAIIPSMWLEVGNFALGVSYDVNISNLRTASNARGGMEISLRFINPNPFKYGGGRGNASF